MSPAGSPRVVTLGETMGLARATDVGSLRHASTLALGIGGSESNVAIALARLGVGCSWLGRVGDDPLGERVTREVRAEGVEVAALVDPEASTGFMLKERSTLATGAVFYYRAGSAGSRLTPTDLPSGWMTDAALLHVTGITALVSQTARETLLAAVSQARRLGVRVSFDVNYRSALAAPQEAAPILRDIADRADIVFGGADELALLGGVGDADAAALELSAGGASEVVLKLGDGGATVRIGDEVVHAPAYPVGVVDTVGAGDAFVAGYLAARLRGAAVRDALVQANACGAIVCQAPGDWEAAPTAREIERFLQPAGDPIRR